MSETAEPKVYLTDEQWAFLKEQELRRTESANQVHREAMRLMAAQATCMNLQETRRMEEKRDYFAAEMMSRIGIGFPNEENRDVLARQAYQMADAMLKARES